MISYRRGRIGIIATFCVLILGACGGHHDVAGDPNGSRKKAVCNDPTLYRMPAGVTSAEYTCTGITRDPNTHYWKPAVARRYIHSKLSPVDVANEYIPIAAANGWHPLRESKTGLAQWTKSEGAYQMTLTLAGPDDASGQHYYLLVFAPPAIGY